MRHHGRGAIAIVTGLALCLAGAARAPAATWDASAIASHAMLYLDAPPAFREAMFREAAATGATSIRVDVFVPLIAAGPLGERSWSEIDDIGRLARLYRLEVVGLLYGTPGWLAECPAGARTLAAYQCPPRDAGAYARLTGEIARHMRGTIDTWQVLNEPNNPFVFAGDVHDYARMLIACSREIRRANPRARIVLGGLGGEGMHAWPARLVAIPGAERAFDIVSVHLRGRLRTVVTAVGLWRRRLDRLGFHGPIWATEHGYPADPAYQWDPRFRGAGAQARYLNRSLPGLIGAGVDRIFITLRDNRGGPWASEGLVGGSVRDPPSADPQILRKPAADAVRRFAMSLLMPAPIGRGGLAVPSLGRARTGHLRAARRCYEPGRRMTLTGAGFLPGDRIRLTFLASGRRAARVFAAREPVIVSPNGTLRARYRAPTPASAADRQERLAVAAVADAGGAPAAFGGSAGSLARLTVTLSATRCGR